MKRIAILLVVGLACLFAQTARADADSDCKESNAYNSVLSLFLIDPTTPFSDSTANRLHTGVRTALQLDSVAGNVQVYMMGAKDYEARLIYSGCIPAKGTVSQPREKEAPPQKTLKEHLLPGNPYKKRQQIKKSTVAEKLNYMQNTVTSIEEAIDSNIVDTKTTCLIHDFGHIMHDQSPGEKDVNVFFFTDLLDTELSKMLSKKMPESSFKELGIKKAKEYKNDSGLLQGGRMNIIVWGVGRNEPSAHSTLTHDAVAKLETFWRTYLTESYGEKKTIRLSFTMDFPNTQQSKKQ